MRALLVFSVLFTVTIADARPIIDLDTARVSAIGFLIGQGLVYIGVPIVIVVLLIRNARRKRRANAAR